jgi:hypothetical protein
MTTLVPKLICDFFNLRYDVKLSKSAIVSKFYTYIRDTQLRNKYNKSLIHLDAALKNLFNLQSTNMLDTTSFIQQIDKIYWLEKKNQTEDNSKQLEETEMELLEKLEIIREKKRLNEIEAKRNYVIYQFIKNSNEYFSDIEAKNLIFYLSEKEYHPIVTYLTTNDKNLLVALQLINKFAIDKNIRYEDALEVIRDYLFIINI